MRRLMLRASGQITVRWWGSGAPIQHAQLVHSSRLTLVVRQRRSVCVGRRHADTMMIARGRRSERRSSAGALQDALLISYFHGDELRLKCDHRRCRLPVRGLAATTHLLCILDHYTVVSDVSGRETGTCFRVSQGLLRARRGARHRHPALSASWSCTAPSSRAILQGSM